MSVYAMHEAEVEIDVTPESTETLEIITDVESMGDAYAYTTIGWQPIDNEGYERRRTTGKSLDFTFSGKRNLGDTGNDYIANLAYGDVITHNVQKITITFPKSVPTAVSAAVLVITGSLEVTSTTGDAATDLAKLEFTMKSDGKPDFTAEVLV